MSAVECKEPGFYKDFDERTDPGDDFGVETEDFKNGDECSYALGKQVLPFPTTTVRRVLRFSQPLFLAGSGRRDL